MPDFGGGYENDRENGGNGFGSSGRGGPGDTKDGASEKNTAYAYDKRTGKVVQVGKPSLMGGMMTTGIGGQMAFLDNWRNQHGTSALGMSTRIGSNASPFHGSYWDNRQRNIQNEAEARANAFDSAYSSIFGNNSASWADRFSDLKALNAGKVGALEKRGYDMSGVKATHRGGDEDVDTMYETAAESDFISYNPVTGAYEMTPAWGYAPLGMMGGVVVNPLTKLVKEVTGSVPVGELSRLGMNKAASATGPATPGAVNTMAFAAKKLGVPVANQVAQMVGLVNGARDLNYVGITNNSGPSEVKENYSGGMMQPVHSIQENQAQAQTATPDIADLMAENWQRLWNFPIEGMLAG